MTFRLGLVALAAVFVTAIPAHGSAAVDLHLSLQIAATHWGDSPACGAVHAQGVVDLPEGIAGHAYRAECRFEYDFRLHGEGYGFADLCNTVVHEVGHLHNLDHTADDTIMGVGTVPACDREGHRRDRIKELSTVISEQRFSCRELRQAGQSHPATRAFFMRRVPSCWASVRRLRARLRTLVEQGR